MKTFRFLSSEEEKGGKGQEKIKELLQTRNSLLVQKHLGNEVKVFSFAAPPPLLEGQKEKDEKNLEEYFGKEQAKFQQVISYLKSFEEERLAKLNSAKDTAQKKVSHP